MFAAHDATLHGDSSDVTGGLHDIYAQCLREFVVRTPWYPEDMRSEIEPRLPSRDREDSAAHAAGRLEYHDITVAKRVSSSQTGKPATDYDYFVRELLRP
jgi:hypothetical protein